jgi:hypothetical protein
VAGVDALGPEASALVSPAVVGSTPGTERLSVAKLRNLHLLASLRADRSGKIMASLAEVLDLPAGSNS